MRYHLTIPGDDCVGSGAVDSVVRHSTFNIRLYYPSDQALRSMIAELLPPRTQEAKYGAYSIVLPRLTHLCVVGYLLLDFYYKGDCSNGN